jgi:hypothetical protein
MGKYDPLSHYLRSRDEDTWSATFADIERELGFTLPRSAREHRAWWANQKGGNHSQTAGWQAAGWETREVDLQRGLIRFERKRGDGKTAERPPTGRSLEDLWQKAERLIGVTDRETLLELALTALIRNELARQVADLGGSDPHATAAPRRRFW